MTSLLPIGDRKALAAIEAVVDALPGKLPSRSGGQYVAAGDVPNWRDLRRPVGPLDSAGSSGADTVRVD